MKKKQQNELIKKLEDKAKKDFEKRNKFNEVGHQIKMFKWLKDKVNKKMNNEMHNCITQNLNFVYMVEARKYALKDNINEEVMSHIYMIKDQSENIQNSKTEGVVGLMNKAKAKGWSEKDITKLIELFD